MHRGRVADYPSEIPHLGWRDIVHRVWERFSNEHILLVAAGISFFVILAFVPALAAFVALYGLVVDPTEVVTQVDAIAPLLPSDVNALIRDQLVRLTSSPERQLTIGAIVAAGLALFSASSATKGLVEGLNIVYAEREKRSWFTLTLLSIALTLAGLIVLAALLSGSVLLPKVLTAGGVEDSAAAILTSYVLLGVLLCAGLAALFRWAPSRTEAQLAWIAPGSVLGVMTLLVFLAAFSWFVQSFATFSTYGSLSVAIAAMTWLWLSVVIVLLAAQINAEAEHQTVRDTTVGIQQPMGSRGAVMADTVGPSVDGRSVAHTKKRNASMAISPTDLAVVAVLGAATVALILQQRRR